MQLNKENYSYSLLKNHSIELVKILAENEISLKPWQFDFMRGSSLIDSDITSGKSYVFMLSYTLGFISFSKFRQLENIKFKMDVIRIEKHLIRTNKHFINMFKNSMFITKSIKRDLELFLGKDEQPC